MCVVLYTYNLASYLYNFPFLLSSFSIFL
uniref:Uncharacterized protein n=1 Tax=Rhizophora mucronata TaxID=61149 RepID=A0A2P2NN63_RHIMU